MDKINPMLYITDHDPVPEAVMDASRWFETEYITLKQSAYNGDFTSTEMLNWYLAQGWVVYDKVTGFDVVSGVKYYYNNYSLKRRKMQSERVLQDLIREFTEAYNEGRTLNDRRYDEIVAIYNVMLDKSENEINGLSTIQTQYDGLIAGIIAGLPASSAAYESKVDGLLDGYGDSLIAEINIRFDNELAKARQELVGRGLYNTTVWTSTSAGIELLRSRALADLGDKITERKIASAADVQRVKMEISSRIEQASYRLMEAKRNRAFGASEFRNAVLSAMLNFMERRTDEYPGLGDLAGIVSQMGYGEGGSVAPA